MKAMKLSKSVLLKWIYFVSHKVCNAFIIMQYHLWAVQRKCVTWNSEKAHAPKPDDPLKEELSVVLLSVPSTVLVANTRISVAVGPHEKLR